jgi:hypothetical protein
MLDDLIAKTTAQEARTFGRRVALLVQRVARLMAGPALGLMFAGLVGYWLTAESGDVSRVGLSAVQVLSLGELLSRTVISPLGAMSVGLLALILVPVVTVLLITIDTIQHRRWNVAVAAVIVSAILLFSVFLGRR